MVKSKWDDIINEANVEANLTDDARKQVELVTNHMIKNRKLLKMVVNGYIILLFANMIFLYIAIIRTDYFMIVFNVIFMVYLLKNFGDAYSHMKIFSGKIKIDILEDKK